MKNVNAVILAAGKGTRMPKAEIPKVLYELDNKPMIEYIVDNLISIGIKKPIVVVGYQAEKIKKFLGGRAQYALQKEQLGTGHATKAAEGLLKGKKGTALVIYGDMPLWSEETYKSLIKKQIKDKAEVVMTSIELPKEYAYGRVIRDREGKISGVIEEKDCSPEELRVKEKNAGLYAFDNVWLFENLVRLQSNNVQHEYYLTDMIGLAVNQGKKVETVWAKNPEEGMGVNTLEDYKAVQRTASLLNY